jgi:hypothetical protein
VRQDKKDTGTYHGWRGTAPQGRCDRGISNTSTSMVAWSIHFSIGNARHASSRLASHDPAHVRYSNGSREKNGVHPKFAVDVPGHWCPPMGRFTQYRPHLRMVAVAKVGGGWANSGRTGLWVSQPWLSIWKSFLETAEETSFQIIDRFRISIWRG